MKRPELLYWKTKHNNVRVVVADRASSRQIKKAVEKP
jgi:hypothetical protein